MKTYKAHIQFEAISFMVKAKNKRDANKAIKKRVAKHKPKLDKRNFYVDEISQKHRNNG